MEINGTTYNDQTTEFMAHLLEDLRLKKVRVRFHWGDIDTGLDWGDEYDVTGTIGRSTGLQKVPILIHNSRSVGGGAILTQCIVKITTAKGKSPIYQHPLYHTR